MGPIGAPEMFVIVLLALLLFGPKKLPELGRMLGKGLTEFRRAKNELKSTFESHMQELDREARLSEQSDTWKRDQLTSSSYSSATYPNSYNEYGQSSTSDNSSDHTSESYDTTPAEQVAGTVPRSKQTPDTEPVSAGTDENRSA
jgi:sec-independent protein translocase protein TatA